MRYIEFKISSDEDVELPFFIGSMLRGAFGASLKETVCINPSYECEGCFAQDNCIYYDFFEAKNRWHDYRFDFALRPERLTFGLHIFNEACEKYPCILSALHRMLTRKGLGRDKSRFENFTITANGERIYDGEFANEPLTPKNFQIDSYCPAVRVEFVTPMRMKKHGRLLRPDDVGIEDVLHSLKQKARHYEAGAGQDTEMPQIVEKHFRYHDITRYSNRQKTKMRIGGVMGSMVLKNVTPYAYRLLKLGEIVGVGKLGTFGLGKIKVEDLV